MHDIQFDCRLMECAKEMIRESLPIKCLEAVVLAMYPFDTTQCEATWYIQIFIRYSRCHVTVYNLALVSFVLN